MKYIENNYSNNLTLEYLAEFSKIDKFYLSREFKKYTGFSPYDYLISVRIEEAKHLLSTTSLSAVKIGVSVGIVDFNNFTRLFKKTCWRDSNRIPQKYDIVTAESLHPIILFHSRLRFFRHIPSLIFLMPSLKKTMACT